MLSLLCSSPRPDDYDFDHGSARSGVGGFKRSGRRMSLPGKKRVQKLSISGPTGFVHTSHIGHDQLGSDMVSSMQWANSTGVGAMRAVSASPPNSMPHTRPQSQPPVLTHDVMHITRRASLPLSSSPVSPTAAPVAPVRRKPIPAYLDETANVSPFPSAIVSQAGQRDQQQYDQEYQHQPYYPHYHQQQQQYQQQPEDSREPMRERQLVRLLDTLPEGRDVDNPMLVTQTTKARFDGAMREITQALRDP